ncbi:MAG TPA: carboxypeptidase regulatory-like domain-containing protein [Candidatus Sulfotelmatobacter sp.]|nr:carboxypeptidase regulatory-like domain-containing protein [Candidatus Sulfotelmatobacter sp.]
MRSRLFLEGSLGLLLISLFAASSAFGQFNASIQGNVTDPSGAAVVQAKIMLENVDTHVTATATSDSDGNYRFVSLAPGSYKVSAEAGGFAKTETNVTLQTGQTLNVPIALKVGSTTESIEVTAENPLFNTAETRNEMTLQTQELGTLPLAGRNMLSLTTVAPGVTGLGLSGGPGVASGTPGSSVNNFSTETAVDVSANGQGTVSNMWLIDGLDVTSAIRQGVLNLVPNPDFIQETSTQVNTYNSEYGRGSGLQVAMTTKSGSDEFHGLVSDYFNYQTMFARYSLPGSASSYSPFHSNNLSGTIGGPIIPHHQFFFFFGVEALRSSASTGNSTVTFPDPAFAAWAQTNYPTTFGTKILTNYIPERVNVSGVSATAASIFPTTCGTPTTNNLPCATPMIDSGTFNSTNITNGTQYFVRIDKYFGSHDRLYGSFFRTVQAQPTSNVIPQFSTTNNYWQRAVEVNWTHTFSPTTLNEAIFAQNRIEGKNDETGDFTIPGISVTGQSVGYGLGFAQGDFIQHNYHWRDVLTHIHGAHVIKVGYDGWYGDDVEPFQGPWSHPAFSFGNLLELAQDAPLTESGVMYNPLTGQQQLWSWNAASKTWGVFAEDTWKARQNLTLTLGFRFDDQGNPYAKTPSTVFGNFYLGTGSTFEQQVASGYAQATHNALLRTPLAATPRIGAAWDINGRGDWVLRGGFGLFSNWLTPANIQEEFRGNPPGLINPTFYANSSTPPVFVQGTSSTPPFGFVFPQLGGSPLCPTVPCLNPAGGIAGASFSVGGITPTILSPTAYIWSATLEHRIGSHFVAAVLYSGSHTMDLVGNGNAGGIVSYGVDINQLPGALIGEPYGSTPARPNPSFGQILYTENNRVANYEAATVDLRARASRGFFDVSYTRSSSKDDASSYPLATNPYQFYGPSPWDTPNRFSATFNYEQPGLNNGQGFVGHLTGGWGISGTSIYQTGYPFTVFTSAPYNGANYLVGANAHTTVTGDYLADGDNNSYPNVSSYAQGTSRSAYTNSGVFSDAQFTVPTAGTNGNEKTGQFRDPPFIETDLTLYKNNRITERLNFQIRFEFFNVFNHPNFLTIQDDLSQSNFGIVNSQSLPRWWQIGGKLYF